MPTLLYTLTATPFTVACQNNVRTPWLAQGAVTAAFCTFCAAGPENRPKPISTQVPSSSMHNFCLLHHFSRATALVRVCPCCAKLLCKQPEPSVKVLLYPW